jgi:hypothetical protein
MATGAKFNLRAYHRIILPALQHCERFGDPVKANSSRPSRSRDLACVSWRIADLGFDAIAPFTSLNQFG